MRGKKVEIFSTGCYLCESALRRIESLLCPSCEVRVLDIRDPEVRERAEKLGIVRVPSILINGKLADCCKGEGISEEVISSEINGC